MKYYVRVRMTYSFYGNVIRSREYLDDRIKNFITH